MTIRELVKNEIDALPEASLFAVQEFVLFQKYRDSLIPGVLQNEERGNQSDLHEQQDLARRRAAFQALMKYHKTLPADFDADKERQEARDEKYGSVN